MNLPDKLMLVSEQTHFNIVYRPNASKLLQDEMNKDEVAQNNILELKDLSQDLQNCILKMKDKEIALNKLNNQKDYALMRSPLYERTFYTMNDFEEVYNKDLAELVQLIFCYMGAKGYCIKVANEERKNEECNLDLSVGVDTKSVIQETMQGLVQNVAQNKQNLPENKGLLNVANSKQGQVSKEEKYELGHKAEGAITLKKSKEEFALWLKQNKIRTEALPVGIKSLVEMYKETGVVKGSFKGIRTETINENAISKMEASSKIIALIKAVSVKLGIKGEFHSKFNAQSKKEISYGVEFCE
ncbi:hypothetical protein [Campylobacter sp. VTCC 70190]|uniref:hypothetical protein n=1 Tax=Campylobacter sp. VTCC 70190 TaxID=3392118 RepID=UPI00398ED161